MLGDTGCCSDRNCGCQMDVYLTTKECPLCGKRLRLAGKSQLAEFRLACLNCGYQSSLLPQEELRELL